MFKKKIKVFLILLLVCLLFYLAMNQAERGARSLLDYSHGAEALKINMGQEGVIEVNWAGSQITIVLKELKDKIVDLLF